MYRRQQKYPETTSFGILRLSIVLTSMTLIIAWLIELLANEILLRY